MSEATQSSIRLHSVNSLRAQQVEQEQAGCECEEGVTRRASSARWQQTEGIVESSDTKFHRLPVDYPTLRILVVEDDAPLRRTCCSVTSEMGFVTFAAGSLPDAQVVLAERSVDLVLLDLKLPGGGGLELLSEIKVLYPHTAVVIMTGYASVSSAVEAMRIGASDYLTKPLALAELTAVLHRSSMRLHLDLESRRLLEQLRTRQGMGDIVGTSPAMERMYAILSKVVSSTHAVLISGECGTGKELVGRLIHNSGPNASMPFITVDCRSRDDPAVLEQEFFGYAKGAFVGANRAHAGLLAAAQGGTVFLDEVGELPIDFQAKLVRALQEREVRPIGGTDSISISARVLAATSRDLSELVAQGRFRKDLYYRLNVVSLRIPPLRERQQDVVLLTQHFLGGTKDKSGSPFRFSDDAMQLLMKYDWPDNVRELQHAVEYACAMSPGPVLYIADLPTQFHAQFGERSTDGDQSVGRADSGDRPNAIIAMAEVEKRAILGAIRRLNGDKRLAARLLGIGKTTLYRKLQDYGLGEVKVAAVAGDSSTELHSGQSVP